ncbi:MAG: LysM peptidoglycan-binding domain-containing protein [Treponema sp.]|nr:LysM peptidoglycan-binding domain-containing protein [Treponema sp.]
MQKKHLVCLTSLIVVSLLAACKTTPVPAEEQQEEVNLSFENVYNRYESRLILDGAVDYEVKSGDRLTGIARQFYGSGEQFGVSNGYFFPLIMLASNDLVQDPDLIEPGMTLSVPDLQRNLDSADARQAMKEFFRDIAGVYEQKAGDETRDDRRKLAEQIQSSLLKLSEIL